MHRLTTQWNWKAFYRSNDYAVSGGYGDGWTVVDPDGNNIDHCLTKNEAIAAAKRHHNGHGVQCDRCNGTGIVIERMMTKE